MSEHVFQDTLPVDAAMRVGKALVTKTFTPELILDGWVVAEFGLRQFVPGGLVGEGRTQVFNQAQAAILVGSLTDDDLTAAGDALLALAEGENREGLVQASAFPWITVVKTIVATILSLL